MALTGLLGAVLAQGGWSVGKVLVLLCFLGVAPWVGLCAATALPGFATLLLARDPPRAVLPVAGAIDTPIRTPTAIVVTIRNEDMAIVLPPLRRLLDGLADAPVAAFILSDTPDGPAAQAEAAAIAAFQTATRLRYRRRSDNTGFKAGNLMEFFDHHAAGFEFAVVLDADSEMSPAAIRKLVGIMQAAPQMGIVQHLTVGRPALAAFPRLFQFGMRAGMRVWATGSAWWQGDAGPYWGHNAILRIAPFRAHCRLEPLPDGSPILSHDQVEAARLRAAGWGVCLWASEDGSMEANPPALPEFLRRDARWLAGNLQYRHLLALPNLAPMGRWQLAQAMLMFVGAPLYTLMLVLTAGIVATGGGAQTSERALLAFALGWTGCIYAPKLLGYAQILAQPALWAGYGGARRFLAGATLEFGFTLLLDAISQPHKSLAMLRLALGARPGWQPQNRGDRGVSWQEATRLFWPHTLLGLAVFALLAQGGWGPVLWALPFAAGLPLAIPFCVLTAHPALSAWLVRRGIAATPEEQGADISLS